MEITAGVFNGSSIGNGNSQRHSHTLYYIVYMRHLLCLQIADTLAVRGTVCNSIGGAKGTPEALESPLVSFKFRGQCRTVLWRYEKVANIACLCHSSVGIGSVIGSISANGQCRYTIYTSITCKCRNPTDCILNLTGSHLRSYVKPFLIPDEYSPGHDKGNGCAA